MLNICVVHPCLTGLCGHASRGALFAGGREVRALMAEADENEDGFVDWREFLPALLPLLRTLQVLRLQNTHKTHCVLEGWRRYGAPS